MKRPMWLILILFALTVFSTAPLSAAPKAATKNVVVHLSKFTGDLHAVMMALKIGTMLVKKAPP